MNDYRQRINEDRLERQAEPVRLAAKDIFRALKGVEQALYWSMDPSEKDGGAYYAQSALDRAHELVDLAHAYRAALKANPPPLELEDDEAV